MNYSDAWKVTPRMKTEGLEKKIKPILEVELCVFEADKSKLEQELSQLKKDKKKAEKDLDKVEKKYNALVIDQGTEEIRLDKKLEPPLSKRDIRHRRRSLSPPA